ncbi:hypothetical protein IscW_ISCW015720, partial [Ixodes scapularis]
VLRRRTQANMKIPASTALAVMAVFLPIVTCAPARKAKKEDDRSCATRDREAKEVGVGRIIQNFGSDVSCRRPTIPEMWYPYAISH